MKNNNSPSVDEVRPAVGGFHGAGESIDSSSATTGPIHRPLFPDDNNSSTQENYLSTSLPSIIATEMGPEIQSSSSSSARKRFPAPKFYSPQQAGVKVKGDKGRTSGASGSKPQFSRSNKPYQPYTNGDYKAPTNGHPNGSQTSQDSLEADLLQLTRELNEKKTENSALQRQVNDMKNQSPYASVSHSADDMYGRLLAEKENLATEVYQLRQKLDESGQRLASHGDESLSSIGHYDPDNNPVILKRKIGDLQAQLTDLQEAHESAAGKLGRAENKLTQLEHTSNQMDDAVNGISVEDLQAENQYLREQMEKLHNKRDNYYHDADARLSEEIEALRADMRTLRDRNQQVNEENLRLRDDLRDVRVRSDDRERKLRNYYNNKQNDVNLSKYNDPPIIPVTVGDKYGQISPERMARLEDNYAPLSSTHPSPTTYYGSTKLPDRSFTSDVLNRSSVSQILPANRGDLSYDFSLLNPGGRLRRSQSAGRLMEPSFIPDCRAYGCSGEIDNAVSSSYYIEDRGEPVRDLSAGRHRSRSQSRSHRRHRTRGRSQGYDDDDNDSDSSTSSILEEVERELGYLRSESQGRSRSLEDSRRSRRHHSMSPGRVDPGRTGIGYRSISPAPIVTQHNKASLGYPTRKSQLSTAGKRPFAPRHASDIKAGDIVKFSRQNGKISKGLVKFVGHLPGRNDIYLGLELENEDGKHDGTYNGQRFFSCKHNKGVFVTFSKVVMVWG